MKKKLNYFVLFLSLLTITISCDDSPNIALEKDADGFYRSSLGNFRIQFHTTPSAQVLDQQIGMEKFKVYSYQAFEDRRTGYKIEYIDIPEVLVEMTPAGFTHEAMLNNLSFLFGKEGLQLTSSSDVTYKDLKGLEFRFDGDQGSVIGRYFKIGNKTYTMYSFGQVHTEKINAFFNSFEILKP